MLGYFENFYINPKNYYSNKLLYIQSQTLLELTCHVPFLCHQGRSKSTKPQNFYGICINFLIPLFQLHELLLHLVLNNQRKKKTCKNLLEKAFHVICLFNIAFAACHHVLATSES